MNSRQQAKQNMYLAIRDFLNANPTITANIPNFAAYFTIFLSYIAQIQSTSEQQKFNKSGTTVSKKQARINLIQAAYDASSKLTAYAKFVNNQLLLTETKYSESDFARFSGLILKDAAQGVYDRAQTNLAALATYGINATTQANFLTAINTFMSSITKPKMVIADHKQITAQLANLFSLTDVNLANIDSAIETVKFSQSAFYKGYWGVHRVGSSVNNKMVFNGLALDAETLLPLEKVKFTFRLDTGSVALNPGQVVRDIEKLTAKKGGFIITSAHDGVYFVTVEGVGLKTQEHKVVIMNGKLSTLKVLMERSM